MPNSGIEWFVILGIVLLLFGGSQLPKMARNLGRAQQELKKGFAEANKEAESEAEDDSTK
jgi:sec-independent protein translocase protein TatA